MKRCRFLAASLALAIAAAAGPGRAHDFPTEALADYVFNCMPRDGQTQQALRRCSCSIDVIASIVPYERYVQAETILRMREISGEKSAIFRENSDLRHIVDDLQDAQDEARSRCF